MVVAHNRVIARFLNAEYRHDKSSFRAPGNKKRQELLGSKTPALVRSGFIFLFALQNFGVKNPFSVL
jgi:hypothetical protein